MSKTRKLLTDTEIQALSHLVLDRMTGLQDEMATANGDVSKALKISDEMLMWSGVIVKLQSQR